MSTILYLVRIYVFHIQALQQAFSALMTADDDKVSAAIQILVARLRREQQSGESLGPTKSLVLQLNDQYPRDVGVLAAFFMNLVSRLQTSIDNCTVIPCDYSSYQPTETATYMVLPLLNRCRRWNTLLFHADAVVGRVSS